MDYMAILGSYLALILALLLILLLNSYYIKFIYVYLKKKKTFKKATNLYKYIVLIPARNESKVIRGILSSLKNQTYDSSKFDVYVITESEDDPTNKIALSYGYKYFVRTNLENRRRKGYAIQEAYEYLKENNIEYDSLVIFDADNILSENYLELLNDVRDEGYEIGVGLRESTNSNTNFISASASLLFTFQSTFVNKGRSILFDKVMISGTGYFINKKIIEDAGGWIWVGLTEDVDLTRYSYIHGIKMGYNQEAIYYDEQPVDLKTLHKQHVRWVWGFMNRSYFDLALNNKPLYRKTNKLGKWEFFFSINLFQFSELIEVAHIVTLLGFIIHLAVTQNFIYIPIYFGFIILDILLMLLICDIANFIELIISGSHFKVNKKLKFLSVLLGFVFWTDWLLAWIDGFLHPKKRKVWATIEHQGKKQKTNK